MSQATLVFEDAPIAERTLSRRGQLIFMLAVALVLAIDVLTPVGVEVFFLYVPLLWATLLSASRRQMLAAAAVCTLLTLVAPHLSPSADFQTGAINRTIVLLAMWFLVYYGSAYRKMVDTLQAREQDLADFIENAAVGMHWLAPDGTVLWANSEQLEMLGYGRAEFIGRGIAEFHVDRRVIGEVLHRLKADAPPREYVAQYRCRDGTVRDLLVCASVQKKQGRIAQVRCFTRDVTDRRRAQQAEQKSGDLEAVNDRLQAEIAARRQVQIDLEKAERQYRELVESVPAIVWRAHARTFQFTFVSRQAEAILGYPCRRWLDEPRFWADHLHPEDRTAAVAYCIKATAELRAHDFEYRMIAADGRTVWLRDLVRVETEHGEARELVGVMVDITAQKQAEERLRDSEDLLRMTFDQAPGGIAIIGPDGRFLKFNTAYRRLVGYSDEELRQTTALQLTHEEDRPYNHKLQQELRIGQRDSYELDKRYRTRDGRLIWVRTKVSAVKDGPGSLRFTVGITQDITERKQAEHALERKTALAQLLEFLARAANDARTPGEAMRICLARICEHGNWVLGRLGMYAPGEGGYVPRHMVWHEKHPDRFAEFKAASLDDRNFSHLGRFITTVLRENRPVWIDDIVRHASSGRLSVALAGGLRSAFAFPVSVRGNVVAFLEFYAMEPRPADALLIEASTSVGALLARLVERSEATEERERLAAIVENSGEAIWSRAADDTLVSWNAAATRLFGWTRDEVIAQRDNILVPPERLHERQLIPDRLARGQDRVTLETVRLRKDGTPIDVELRASAVRDDAGNVKWTAFIVHDITERKAAETALRDYSTRLQTLSRRLIDAQERERAVIARELHDQTGQVLSVLKLTLQIARRDARARQVAPHLDEALQHIDTALQQVRTLSYSLRPPQLDDLGLVAALRNFADRIGGAAGLALHYDIQAPPRLSGQAAIACFRVAQEAITNVVRHAAAKNLWIGLACDDELRLEVRDDGKGCDMIEVRRRALRGDSMGVVNMEERTLLGGGRIDLASSPGSGTVVRANFPFCIEEPAPAAEHTT